MQTDVNNYFGILLGIEGRMMKKNVRCFVLKRADHATTSGGCGTGGTSPETVALTLERQLQAYGKPVVVSEELHENICLTLEDKTLPLQTVRDNLQQAGYALTEEMHDVDMLVIREKD